MREWVDSCLLNLFVKVGSLWFSNVAFSCDPNSERVRHMIFATNASWLEKIIDLIEKAESK